MKKIIYAILAVVMSGAMMTMPAMAASCTCAGGQEGVPTAILGENGCSCDDGNGSAIWHVASVVVDIMTVGIGILGVIGISVTGVQYLTAGGSEEKTRKAKRRMFEIVIGLVAYVTVYALLKWLMPDFTDSVQKLEDNAFIIFRTLLG